MALDTNFNVNPYYDDFDEDKKFLRMLFKPGYAVQARELTQLQTILQKQVQRFGDHIFEDGSVVTGGQLVFQNTTFINVSTSYAGSTVNVGNFEGLVIVDNVQNPTKKAQVIKVFTSNTTEPPTLLVNQLLGSFSSGDTISTYNASIVNTPTYANIAASGVGTGQIFSVDEGVYYYGGFFVKVDSQTVAVSKYDEAGSARIGFQIDESIVAYTADTSLLDPAQNASNYQAPGADRYKVTLTLSTRSLTSTDDVKFIELARVQDGVLTKFNNNPLYAVLEDTLARRTYDESGNYTVKPFNIALQTSTANTANLDIILSPGKAYVYGYEHETIYPTVVTIDKPRTTDSVNNKRITADYGYYVYANTPFGSFPINSLDTVELHCVPNASINLSSSLTRANSRIGNVRVKSIAYDSAANTQNSASYTYQLFLTDINVGSIYGGNVNTVISATNTSYIQIANTVSNLIYSNIPNAYTGAKFRVIAGPGAGEVSRSILNFNGTTQTIQVDNPFVANVNVQSTWAIDFEFNDCRSLFTPNTAGTGVIAAMNIDAKSRDQSSIYNDTLVADSGSEKLIFSLGQSFVANGSISDMSYSYRRLYENQAFSGTTSPALTLGTGETLSYTGSTTGILAQNYYVVCTSAGGIFKKGDLIPATAITGISGNQLTITGSTSMTANIIATIDVSAPNQKVKTYKTANTDIQIYGEADGGINLFANNSVFFFGDQGQVQIAANTVVKSPDTAQSLFTSDVVNLVSVLDFNGTDITVANEASATNVTSRYVLFSGQKDSFYDHAYIKLIPGYQAPVGPLVVKFNHFSSIGAGFFTVTSYTGGGYPYENIPAYIDDTGIKYEMRDSLDFRSVRANATTATANTVVFDVDPSTTGPKIPENGSDILADYQYYLARRDKVVLNKNKTFEVIEGVPSLKPLEPENKQGTMTLYKLSHDPYLLNSSNTKVSYVNNKRYTMRDIGTIEKRVENLEYYTSLSLLELEALNKQDLTIKDTTNLPRFKNGIVVDAFTGQSVSDVTKLDYKASIDTTRKEVRPTYNIASFQLFFDSSNSSGYNQTGPFITLSSTPVSFIEQTKASKTVNVNPYSVVNYLGKIDLNPKSDTWVDTTRQADVLVNLEGDKDAWALIANNAISYQWDSTERIFLGSSVTTQDIGSEYDSGGGGFRPILQDQLVTTVNSTKVIKSGVATSVVPQTIQQRIGDKIIDASIIPYMRSIGVLFTGSDFEPKQTLYPFFDNTLVEKYVSKANKFILEANNLNFFANTGNQEAIVVRNMTTGINVASAVVVRTSNNQVFVASVRPNASVFGSSITNANLIGSVSSTTIRIKGYEHYSGNASTANVSNIVLRIDASGANNEGYYGNTANGNTIFIVSGTGAGQQRTINAYSAATRTARISSNWTTIPDANSVYTIGRPESNEYGDTAGIYFIPASTFRVGEKKFRLINNSTNDLGSSSTNGDASFFAQGLLETLQDTIISATVPTTQRVSAKSETVVTNTIQATTQRITGWIDPLAQTFLISPVTYQNGVYINSVRLCFESKSDTVPVTLQIRPTVNGYPSYATIYPYATVTLTPDKVKVVTDNSPDLDNQAKYTQFNFSSPIYIQPGEHSFCLITNCQDYKIYAAAGGALDLASGQQISPVPYGGLLFLSQNGSTWIPEAKSSMTFRMYRENFSTSPSTATFKVLKPSANTVYDVANLVVGDMVIPSTSISYKFNSIVSATGSLAGYKSLAPSGTYTMNDGSGRRVLTTTNDGTKFRIPYSPANSYELDIDFLTGITTTSDSFVVQATMTTQDSAISPIIDTTRMGVIVRENIINNLPLANSGFAVTAGGTGYSAGSPPAVTITGGNGSGAIARANVTAAGVIDAIYLTNTGGSGYTVSPTVTIASGVAKVTYNGEDKKSGGNAAARHIVRKVTLADGFESGDLRVYVTAYKPAGGNIFVYYKLLSESDPSAFDDNNYQLMTENDSNINFISNNERDYRELSFAPGVNNIANNSISYVSGTTSFKSFRTFAIKIVLTGTDPTDVPKLRDFRAIALPEGS
jgi:hypothetical protein